MAVYQHDLSSCFCFEIRGDFYEADAEELGCCWRTARPAVGKRPFIVDLEKVTHWNEAGLALLRDLHAGGVTFTGQSEPACELRRLVTGEVVEALVAASERPRFWARLLNFFVQTRSQAPGLVR